MRRRWPLLVLWVLLLAPAAGARDAIGQNLIVFLIEGFPASVLNSTKFQTLFGFQELVNKGVQSEYLRSSFPSHSWPNWVSLSTGLYTESHGITADYMWTADQDEEHVFQRYQSPSDRDDIWWNNVPAPFWYTVGKSGIDVSCYFFAHCERPFADLMVMVPEARKTKVNDPTESARLPEFFPDIVRRLTKYGRTRQQVFLLRSSQFARAARRFGLSADDTEAELAKVDLHLVNLQNMLSTEGLFENTNLIVLSDHGLSAVDEEMQFYIDECLSNFDGVRKVVNSHGVVFIYADEEAENEVYLELKICDQWSNAITDDEEEEPLVSAYRVSDLPDDLHFANSRFLPSIILIPKPGVSIVTRDLSSIPRNVETNLKAADGWHPNALEMRGIFLARGPAFKSDEKVGPIDMVDVYQVIMNILGVEPGHTHNGSWAVVEPMLHEGCQAEFCQYYSRVYPPKSEKRKWANRHRRPPQIQRQEERTTPSNPSTLPSCLAGFIVLLVLRLF